MVDEKDQTTKPQLTAEVNAKPNLAENKNTKDENTKAQSTTNLKTKRKAIKQDTKNNNAKAKPTKAVKTASKNVSQSTSSNTEKAWKALIAGCFGDKDKRFAKHENDKDRAYKLLTVLREEKVGWKEFRKEVKRFLNEKTPDKASLKDKEIKKQLSNVREHIKIWLKND